MKKWQLGCLFLLFTGLLLARTPGLINYQGVLSDGNGAVVADGGYDITFRLYDEEGGGSELWSETQTISVSDGVFSAMLGSANALDLPFDAGYWLGIAVNGGDELAPRLQLGASPYSLHAQNVADSSITTEKIADGAITPAKLAAGISFDQPWTRSGSTLSYTGGRVGIGTATPINTLSISGGVDVNDISNGAMRTRIYGSQIGALETKGSAGSRNVLLTYTSGNEDNGFMGVFNPNSDARVYGQISNDVGQMVTIGANNTNNVRNTFLANYPNHGYVGVYDAGSSVQAGMYVNSSGQGVVYGDIKNFRMTNPYNPSEEIWYASLEGPEAAAYLRGTIQLVGGKATVEFPEHF
nr:hypothetical protein [Calditrichia bacterium]